MALYRDFTSVEELDKQYLPGLRVANAAEIRAKWTAENARVGKAAERNIAYGPTCDEYVDVFRGPKGAPVHVFIHGGYWRANAPADFHFVAEQLVKDGFCVVIPNYSLCPKVSIDEIVRQMRACLKWLHQSAGQFDANPANITISGHSAGGQLTAMMLATDWQGEYGLDPKFLKGGCAVSGLYDLAPFPYTTLQPSLQLTWDQVARNSAIKIARKPSAPLSLYVGGDESEEFHRQMNDYAKVQNLEAVAIPATNHFTVLGAYLDPASALYKKIKAYSAA